MQSAGSTPRRPAAPREPGLVLGRYRLLRRLGAGGFGVVWEAHDEALDRPVAVKRVPLPRGAPAERARREALVAARLSHPAIVALFEARAEGGELHLVSELVRGPTLAELIASGALDDDAVLRIGRTLCAALAHAHERRVVHRDVKPQNVIVPSDPAAGVAAKLTDFGVALLAGEEELTRTGDVLGTFAYMAPEQADGRPVDERADLYALGVVLYECLAGVNPVRAATPAATARRVGRPLPALGRLRADLPGELVQAIDRAVDRRPERRGTLEDLRAALERPDPHGHGEPDPEPVALRRSRRRIGGRLAGALLAALAAPGALLALAPSPSPPPLVCALLVGAAVLLLPRLGWMAAAIALIAWLASCGQAGSALLLATALAPVPLLFAFRAPALWSLPALAPLLAVPGLAGAFPALLWGVRSPPRRLAAGVCGGWWVLLAEPLSGRRLWFGAPEPGAPVRRSLAGALDALGALLSSPTALGALAAFGLLGVLVPGLVRPAPRGRVLPAAAAWAALGVVALLAAGSAGSARPVHGSPRGLVPGALAGAVVAAGRAALAHRSRSMASD